MARYAVMGHSIAYSLSPTLHQAFAKQTGISLTYDKIEVPVTDFEAAVTRFFDEGGRGLNITQPFKERAYAMSDEVTPRGHMARAVNTLWMREGRLCADNTDGIGFLRDVMHDVSLVGQRVALLGAGGAARGVLAALMSVSPALITVIHRNRDKFAALLLDFPGINGSLYSELQPTVYDVVINATSAHGRLPSALIIGKPYCYEISYPTTAFMADVVAAGLSVRNGQGMLVEQAAEAFFIWHQVRPDTSLV